MTLLIAVAKVIGGPGSIGFLVAGSLVALLVWRLGGRRWRTLSRVMAASLAALYLTLSLPPVAYRLTERLTSYSPLADLAPLAGVRTILVFDGDNRRGRVAETRRLFDAIQPERVVVSGSHWIVDDILQAGIPRERLVQESASRNTLEQVELLRYWPRRSVVIVASRFQMPRIAAFLASTGNDARLAPAPADAEIETLSSIQWLIPQYSALRISRDVLYELAALKYYRRIGTAAS